MGREPAGAQQQALELHWVQCLGPPLGVATLSLQLGPCRRHPEQPAVGSLLAQVALVLAVALVIVVVMVVVVVVVAAVAVQVWARVRARGWMRVWQVRRVLVVARQRSASAPACLLTPS
jgi:hypothetical protein